ncbi:Transmembrane_domain-containing protein [Hexamita inflata]|uniref:Transmembrane_domain-containing protein n=2 Tax=Hexamita inflata TaxID=28002 RepID=A0ABP1GGC7_9EUKA
MGKCKDWMKFCVDQAPWSSAYFTIGSSYCVLQCVASITVLVMYIIKLKNKCKDHVKIFAALILCMLFRSLWWVLSTVQYKVNSLPLLINQISNRLSFLCIYFAQSFYIHSWLKILQMMQNQYREKRIRLVFIVCDVIASISFIFSLATLFFQGTSNDIKANAVYQAGVLLVSFSSVLISVVLVVVGSLLIKNLRFYFKARQLASFIIVCFVFTICAIIRVGGVISQTVYPDSYNTNVFLIFTVILPECVPSTVITVLQCKILQAEKKKTELCMATFQNQQDDASLIVTII